MSSTYSIPAWNPVPSTLLPLLKPVANITAGMLTLELEDDLDKMNCFIRELKLVHYAMTLGGYRTTMSYPPFSSHDNLTREERYAIGITEWHDSYFCGHRGYR